MEEVMSLKQENENVSQGYVVISVRVASSQTLGVETLMLLKHGHSGGIALTDES